MYRHVNQVHMQCGRPPKIYWRDNLNSTVTATVTKLFLTNSTYTLSNALLGSAAVVTHLKRFVSGISKAISAKVQRTLKNEKNIQMCGQAGMND